MTNREFIEKLTPEELVQTHYFVDCPYGYIYKAQQAEMGNPICKKEEELAKMSGSAQIADFVFSGKQREICNACKLKWLSKEHK